MIDSSSVVNDGIERYGVGEDCRSVLIYGEECMVRERPLSSAFRSASSCLTGRRGPLYAWFH